MRQLEFTTTMLTLLRPCSTDFIIDDDFYGKNVGNKCLLNCITYKLNNHIGMGALQHNIASFVLSSLAVFSCCRGTKQWDSKFFNASIM